MPVVTPLRPDDPRRVGRYRLAGRIADQVTDQGPGIIPVPAAQRHPGGGHAARHDLGPGRGLPGPVHRRGPGGPPGRPVLRRADPGCRVRRGPALPGQRVHRGAVADRGDRGGGAAGRAGAHRAGHRRGHRAGRHPPGRAGARRLRPGRSHSGRGGAPGGPVQHHPALWHRDPVGRPVLLGPDHPVRRVRRRCRPDLASLPESLRGAVSACLAEQGSRPQARALLTALLGQGDPAAGLLAEGTRRARAAGRGVVGPSQQDDGGSAAPVRPAPGGVHRGLRRLHRGHRHRHHADRDAPWAAPHPGRGGHGRSRQQVGPGHRDGLAHRRPRRSPPRWPAPGPGRCGRPTRRSPSRSGSS